MRALPERPSASSYREEDRIAVATTLSTDLVTPVFQPLRGETGRKWEAIEYGIASDNSSFISADSAAECEDTDEEIMSFDLGIEPFDQLVQDCLPSDEYLDDLQQGTNTCIDTVYPHITHSRYQIKFHSVEANLLCNSFDQ